MIGIYIVTKNMTVEQHDKGLARLLEAGAPRSAMKLHSCFGEDGQLQVFDVWESQEAFDEFLDLPGADPRGHRHRVGTATDHHADRAPRPAVRTGPQPRPTSSENTCGTGRRRARRLPPLCAADFGGGLMVLKDEVIAAVAARTPVDDRERDCIDQLSARSDDWVMTCSLNAPVPCTSRRRR